MRKWKKETTIHRRILPLPQKKSRISSDSIILNLTGRYQPLYKHLKHNHKVRTSQNKQRMMRRGRHWWRWDFKTQSNSRWHVASTKMMRAGSTGRHSRNMSTSKTTCRRCKKSRSWSINTLKTWRGVTMDTMTTSTLGWTQWHGGCLWISRFWCVMRDYS